MLDGCPGARPDATVPVLSVQQVVRRAARDCGRCGWTLRCAGCGMRRARGGEPASRHPGEHQGGRRSGRVPVDLQSSAEASQRADQRRSERDREGEAAGRVHEVEADSLADVDAELREAVVAVGDPIAAVLQRGEAEADHEADNRQRQAAEAAAGGAGQQRADDADEPQPAICHGVHGPCPKKKFEVSAASAPTTYPGAAPSAKPATSTMSVVGFTFGSAANAIRPSEANALSAATSATSFASGPLRSYQANPATSPIPRIRNEESCQVTSAGAPERHLASLRRGPTPARP